MVAPNKVRVRFAPSPTGFLHVGGLRTALFNFLFARKNNGVFVLRIEDTDKSRIVKGAAEEIQSILKEFGLEWDEGPVFQSQRLKIYQEYAQKLIEVGAAYGDSTSPPPLHPAPALWSGVNLPLSASGGPGEKLTAIRQRIPKEGSTSFKDAVYGEIIIENSKLDEGVLLKSDGYPVYNLANVIDDHEMGITYVIRGEEFIPSTPKHILLYQALGWQPPQFIHLPLILDRERKKLSKRTGDVAVKEYLKQGYLKQAILNFIALLGWNPKSEKEIFSLEELVHEFAVEKINKAGAIFDIEKLDFINREWQKRLNLGEKDPLHQRAKKLLKERFEHLTPTLSGIATSSFPSPLRGEGGRRPDEGGHGSTSPAPRLARGTLSTPGEGGKVEDNRGEGEKVRLESPEEEYFNTIWPLILERIKGPSELEERLPEFYFFFETPNYDKRLLQWKNMTDDEINNSLAKSREIISNFQFLISKKDMQKAFFEAIGETDKGKILWPLRVALSGQKDSPSPFEIIDVFASQPNGKEITLKRIEAAIEKL